MPLFKRKQKQAKQEKQKDQQKNNINDKSKVIINIYLRDELQKVIKSEDIKQ
jgi:hypothetical protein